MPPDDVAQVGERKWLFQNGDIRELLGETQAPTAGDEDEGNASPSEHRRV
jgi:hypothetical protein